VLRTFALIGLAGCDVPLGLHHLPPGPIDAAADAYVSPHVAGHLEEMVVTSTAAGTPLISSRIYAASEIQLAVTLADGSTPALSYDEQTGDFGFPLASAGQAYRLVITGSDSGTVEYQLAAPNPRIDFQMFSRLDRVPVTLQTTVRFQYGALTGSALIDSIGNWTQSNPGQNNTGTFDFDWRKASPFTGTVGLLEAAKFDRLYYIELNVVNPGTPSAYNLVAQYSSSSVTLVDGQLTTITAALTAPGQNRCGHIIAARNQALTRLLAAQPRSYVATGADWEITAVPALTLGITGFLIALGNENAPGTDVDVQAGFFNPFAGTEHVASVGAGANFNVQLPGTTTPLTIGVGSRQYMPLDTSGTCFSNVAQLQLTIAMPQVISVGGTALTADNTPVGLGPDDVAVTWTSTPGPVDYALVNVFEVQKQGSATATATRYMLLTATPGAATVPRSVFESGKTYIIEVSNKLGLDIAAGDLETQHYPSAISIQWSHIFVP
jgi:hypothetical protein